MAHLDLNTTLNPNLNKQVFDRLLRWRRSPLLFATECMHFKPSDQQAEALVEAAKSLRITIRSGHGTGKDAVVGGVIIPWFLVTRPFAKVVCTAPTGRQLSDILWSEISPKTLSSKRIKSSTRNTPESGGAVQSLPPQRRPKRNRPKLLLGSTETIC
jgi:hypothetical protein